jgi:hypothetical protein
MSRNAFVPASPVQAVVIGHGGEATVQLDRAAHTVTKVYSCADPEKARRAAAREYRILGELHRVLRWVPGLTCPRRVALTERLAGVRMEFRGGLPLAEYLARRHLDPDEVAWIARTLAQGLHAYVIATGEAYYDFCPQNILVDAATDELVLVDFGIPEAQRPLHRRFTRMQLSVGNFLGWSVYETLRPANIPVRRVRARLLQTYRAMRDVLCDEGDLGSGDAPHVESVARFTYRRLTARGSALRRAWYRAAGALCLPGVFSQARREWRS